MIDHYAFVVRTIDSSVCIAGSTQVTRDYCISIVIVITMYYKALNP